MQVDRLSPDSLLAELLAARERARFDWMSIAETGLRIAVILLLAWLGFRLLGVLLRRAERRLSSEEPGISAQQQRIRTLLSLFRSVGIVVIAVISIFMVLGALGIDIGPLLAGAGVLGLAISFGAQSLVKDVISGLFILVENQFGVGDVIRVGDAAGVVERMTLRSVALRDIHGVVHILPNGEMGRVSNMTRSWSRAVLDIGVAYKEDVDRVMEVMRQVAREFEQDAEWGPLLVGEITVPGIEALGDSAVVVRMLATTLPLKQWDVARQLRLRLKRRFDAEGIEIPFPHRTLYWGEGQQPSAADRRLPAAERGLTTDH